MNEEKREKDLADELESLRLEISHLLNLIRHQAEETRPAALPGGTGESSLPTEVFERGPFGVALADGQLRIVKANRAFLSMLDYPQDAVPGLSIGDIAGDAERCTQLISEVLGGAAQVATLESRFVKRNQESSWARVTIYSIEGPDGAPLCCLFMEGISEQKNAEIALRSEKRLLESLINSSDDGIMAFDRAGLITLWNAAMEQLSGVSREEAVAKPAQDVFPFLKDPAEETNLAAALAGERRVSRGRRFSAAGTTREVRVDAYYGPLTRAIGEGGIGGFVIIRDVTVAGKDEEKRLDEERYRELFENSCDMVCTLDLYEKITSFNKAAERITGRTRAEALQMLFSDLVAPESRQNARRMIQRQIAGETPVVYEIELLSKDESRTVVEASCRLIFRQGRAVGIHVAARDITERKRTEDALQKENRALEEWVNELEQRTRELTLLSEMGDILRACLTTEEVYEVIVRVSQELFPRHGGALFVLGPARNIVESVAQWGISSVAESTFTPDECWGLRRGRVHWVEDCSLGLVCKHVHTPYPHGYLCVPMMAQGEAVGVLHLTQPDDVKMPEAKQRLATAMAEHVAMALSNLRLHERLRTQSIRDQLTGLFNRSFMEESLELELRRAVRSQQQLSVIMLELDGFQTINENYGVEVGDSILRRTGMLLQANVRKGDIACRYTGQTYVVILPQSDLDIGRKRAETLCGLVRTLEVKYQSTQVGHITGSFGLAVFPGHGQTVENLLRSAEAALSRAKSAGGDSVVVAK
ncbi:MAG: PAS domain S-box protein [Acidobacteria bacterium]|nr:PAS domain S-box protein [Acidobacteriota bacterium]